MKFPPGTYYVGDPCYAIADEDWHEFVDNLGRFEDMYAVMRDIAKDMNMELPECDILPMVNDGFLFEFHGEQVWCARTRIGDGVHRDQINRKFMVDAGLLGVLPVILVTPDPEEPAVEPRVLKVDGGHIIEFTEEFDCERKDAMLRIGHIEIDLDPPIDQFGHQWTDL